MLNFKKAVFISLLFVSAVVYAADKSIPGIKNNPDGTISVSSDVFNYVPPSQSTRPALVDNPQQPLPERIKLLVNKLGSTSPIPEQTGARNKLIKIGKDAIPYLNNYLNTDKRTYVRIHIANILGVFKDVSSIEPLKFAAASRYISLNKTAVKNIGEIGGKQAVEALEYIKKNAIDEELIKEIDILLSSIKK